MPLTRRIREETITPLFRQGDFAGGIDAGVDQMIKVIDGEPLPPPDQRWRNSNETGKSLAPLGNSLPFLIFAVIIGSVILRRDLRSRCRRGGHRRCRWRARLAVHAPRSFGVLAGVVGLHLLVARRLVGRREQLDESRGGRGGGFGGWGGGGFGGAEVSVEAAVALAAVGAAASGAVAPRAAGDAE